MLPLFKNFLKFGGDPVRWRDDWLKELGMSRYERTAIEVGVLTRSLWYLGTYDQLNCPCLAGVEVLCQRLSQLIDAYAAGDACRPNFKGVRHFVSDVSSTSVAPTHLRTYAHKRAKEEHDMEALRQKAGAGPGVASGSGADDGDDSGISPSKAKEPKGRGKAGPKPKKSGALTAEAGAKQ